ncbi:MAG: rhomboid family intramembrane serine protease [Candidatus Binatia bacterium]
MRKATGDDSSPQRCLCEGLGTEQLDAVTLLLAAMAIETSVRRDFRDSSSVLVSSDDYERARSLLEEEFPSGIGHRSDQAAPFVGTANADERGWFGPGSSAVVMVVLGCTLLFAATHGGIESAGRARMLEMGAISWSLVERGEYWRLGAAVFLHFNLAHLLSNMFTLLLTGPPLARMIGARAFLVVFGLSGVAGNIASHLLNPSAAIKAGASGAIAGIIGALFAQALRTGRRHGRLRSWQVVGGLAAFYAMVVGFGPGRDNLAHLGGLLAGLVAGLAITRNKTQPSEFLQATRYQPRRG